MGRYAEKKKEIMGEKKGTKVFNASDFNKLGTAILNDPEYVAEIASVKEGKVVTTETTPVADLRQKLIGGVLKAAGVDSQEQAKFVQEYQFPTLPLNSVVSEILTEYMGQGKPFTFNRKGDFKASILIEDKKEEVKEVKSPATGEVSKKRYGAYRKLKAKSTCPDNLKFDV